MPEDERYDLGVLLVHGIGEQERGQTLTDFGTPLAEWLASRANATVAGAIITDEDDQPSRATVTIEHPEGTQQWLLAESWWAESFHTPPFSDLARWGYAIAPWTIGSHFGERLRRIWNDPGRGRLRRVTKGPKLAVAALSLLGGVVMSIGVSVALLLLLWLSFIPWQRLRDSIAAIQRKIAAWLGDSYLFVARPIDTAAIIAKVRHDLDWLSVRCRRVAVVAHSQGAAVACHTLAGGETAPRLLVTFGSGLRKLEQQRYIRRNPQFIGGGGLTVLGVLATCLSPLAILRMVALYRQFGMEGFAGLAALAIYPPFGIGLLAAGLYDFLNHRDPDSLEDICKRIAEKNVVWKEFVATADPVPNGRLEPVGTLPPASTEIVNVGSLFADHGAYWRNRDVFVSHVGNELLHFAGSPVPGVASDLLTKLSVRRIRRVRVLRLLWWTTMAALAAAVVRQGAAWRSVARWSLTKLPAWLLESLPIPKAPFPSAHDWRLSAGIVAMAAVGYAAVRAAWNALNDAEMRSIYGPTRRARPFLVFAVTVSIHLVLLSLAVTTALDARFYQASLAIAFVLAAMASPQAMADAKEGDDGPQPATKKVFAVGQNALVVVAMVVGSGAMALHWIRGLRHPEWALGIAAVVAVVIAVITLIQRRKAKPQP